jgi:hypothetical protein
MSQPTRPTPLAGRPARRRRPLLAAAVLAVLGLGAVGVRLALDVGWDTAVATAGEAAAPIAGGLTPSAGVPSGQPPAGLPPSAVPPPSAVLPPATQQPVGLGGDPALDGAATGCFTGVMSDCVELYLSSYRDPALQRYTAYGDTCAGRQPAGTLRLCTASFPR